MDTGFSEQQFFSGHCDHRVSGVYLLGLLAKKRCGRYGPHLGIFKFE
jgi:hypothetical protein